jgi:cathepsin L
MLKAVIFLALLSVTLCALTERQYGIEFGKFVQKYNKSYASSSEQAYRYRVFKKNLEQILAHNEQNLGFTLAVNHFADLTTSEFSERFLGLKFNATSRKPAPAVHRASTKALPDTVDWRTKGAVTPVKDQGQCGSCWSFSTTGSVEGAWFLKKGSLVSLSEQNLVDCSTSQGNQGCNGGLMDDAFQYIISNKGLDTEKSYPYEAEDDKCRFKAANVGATISSFVDVKSGSESDLQSAVAQQPVSVAIDASHFSFQFYSSGVYYEKSCSATELDHGVLAVGYGTDSGKDYWLVKNSWAASWGDKGYIKMSRNKSNNCGIATASSYPVV